MAKTKSGKKRKPNPLKNKQKQAVNKSRTPRKKKKEITKSLQRQNKSVTSVNIKREITNQKEAKKREKYEREKAAKQRRFEEKVKRLIDAGYKPNEAKKAVGSVSRQLSYEHIENLLLNDENKPYVTKDYFYIGFADLMGNGMLDDDMSAQEALDQINERMTEVGSKISGSPDRFTGAFKIDYGDKEDLEHLAIVNYRRSYNFAKKHPKFDGKQYHVVCNGNTWTKREFLNMVNNCVQGMPNADVKPFVEKAKLYCERNGLPFFE